jgi:hypothetical protein
VYACYPDRIRANDKKNTDSIKLLLLQLPAGDTCIRNTGSWFVNHYDDAPEQNCIYGRGSVPQIAKHDTDLAMIPVKPLADEQLYEFSCWFLLGTENYRSPYFKVDLLDMNHQLLRSHDALTKESTDNHGDWYRCALFFNMPANCRFVRIHLVNDPDNSYKYMDELMLKPADALIISKSASGRALVNNHLLE